MLLVAAPDHGVHSRDTHRLYLLLFRCTKRDLRRRPREHIASHAHQNDTARTEAHVKIKRQQILRRVPLGLTATTQRRQGESGVRPDGGSIGGWRGGGQESGRGERQVSQGNHV